MSETPSTAAADSCKVKPDVRTRLLNAAIEVVRNEGIHALTQSRVSVVAGVRQSHLTYYYPTRKALLTAIAEACAEITVCSMGHTNASDLPPTLRQYFQYVADQMIDPAICRIMIALTYSSEEDASLKVWMKDFRKRAMHRFHVSLQHYGVKLSASQLAFFYAFMTGLSVVNLSESTEQSARELRRLFLIATKDLVASTPKKIQPSKPSQTAVCID